MPPPRLLAAGSIALDSLSGPYGSVEGELGGSALYFALAAALVRPEAPVEVVAPVGRDARAQLDDLVAGRAIDASGVATVDAPTYRWRAEHAESGNRDLGGRDSIYDHWVPEVPAGFDGWLFVGSMRTDRQLDAARGGQGARLTAVDAMRSYIAARPGRFAEVLALCGWFFATDDELAALDGGSADDFRTRHGLDGLVVKHGAQGVSAHAAGTIVNVGPPAGPPVIDTTGAGDALAGGFLAAWSMAGGAPGALGAALRTGVACASIAIEDIGLRALRRATPADLARRLAHVPAPVSGPPATEFERSSRSIRLNSN